MAIEKKQNKRELRKARKAEQEAAAREAEKAATRRRLILTIVPITTLVISVGFYLNEGTQNLAGITLLVGFLLWLALSLTMIGSNVPARDRTRGGSINYGSRRR